MTRVGGLLVEREGQLGFLPASVAQCLVDDAVVTRVPGTQLGMTLVAGRVVLVLSVGEPAPSPSPLLLCELAGELVAVAGLRVLDVGLFEATGGGVRVGHQVAAALDLGAELARLSQTTRRYRRSGEAS